MREQRLRKIQIFCALAIVLIGFVGLKPAYALDDQYDRLVRFDKVFFGKGNSGSGSPITTDDVLWPRGLARDASGNFYTVEQWSNRIHKISSTGTHISVWGSDGTANGQFKTPSSIAVDGSGNMYVTEVNNHRIQKLDSSGAFLAKYEGVAPNNMSSPEGVALDSSGNIYISNAGNNKIVKLTSSMTYITSWAVPNYPGAIYVDPSNNIYVGQQYGPTISVYSPTGTPITSFDLGAEGASGVSSITKDADGNLYVGTKTNKTLKLGADYKVKATWTFGPSYGMIVDNTGTIYAAVGDRLYKSRIASPNNNLTSLAVAGHTLNPAFDKTITDYTVNVDGNTTSLDVTMTQEDAAAKITLNSVPVVSGTQKAYTVGMGKNTFDYVVTADSGDQKTYKLTVNVKAPPDMLVVSAVAGHSKIESSFEPQLYAGAKAETALRFDLKDVPESLMSASLRLGIWEFNSSKTAGDPFIYDLFGSLDNGWEPTDADNAKRFPKTKDVDILRNDSDDRSGDYWKNIDVLNFVKDQTKSSGKKSTFIVGSPEDPDYMSFYGLTDGNKGPYLYIRIPAISKTTEQFDRATANQADISFEITVSDVVSKIENGGTVLNSGSDYTISGNVVTIKKGYLATLPLGNTNLTITMAESSPQTLKVDVKETASPAISTASLSGIAAPSAGALPGAKASLTPDAATYTVSQLIWQNSDGTPATLTSAGKFKAGTVYKAVVELTAASGQKFQASGLTPTVNAGTAGAGTVSGGDVSGNKLTFTVTFNATAAQSVAGMTVKAQPSKLSYTAGDALDLSGLVATLSYNDGSTADVGVADFGSHAISAAPAHGAVLSVGSHHGQAVQLTCGAHNASTSSLSVSAPLVSNISSASLTGLLAPSAGALPGAKASLTPGAATYTVSQLIWQNSDGTSATLTSAGKFKAGTVYKAVVELTAASGQKFQASGLTPIVNAGTAGAGTVSGGDVSGNKLTFTVTFNATAAQSVAGMTVKVQPSKLSYTAGDALDLSGLVATLSYNDGSTADVGVADFGSHAISAAPAHGAVLSVGSHHGQAVQLTCGAHNASTSSLSVSAPLVSNISSASLTGLLAPSVGGTPQSKSSLMAGSASYSATNLEWQNGDGTPATLTSAGKFKAGTMYKAVVELTAASGQKFQASGLTPTVDAGIAGAGTVSGGDVSGNKLTFPVTFNTTTAQAITGILVKAQPVKMNYTAGDALDLSGLVVTLSYSDGVAKDVALADFGNHAVGTNPTNGTQLSVSEHHGQLVYLTCGAYTTTTSSISVTAVPVSEISSASLAGLLTPVSGAAPASKSNLTAGAAAYTVTNLTWLNGDGTAATLTSDGKFKPATMYQALIELTAASGQKFKAGGFTPSVSAGTARAGVVSGGDAVGNKLTFMVMFSATEPEKNSSGGSSNSSSGGGKSSPSASAPLSQNAVIVKVNGKAEDAGTETKSSQAGKSVVTVDVSNQAVNSKIEAAVKNNPKGEGNLIQVSVTDTASEVAKVALTGDIIKNLEANTFDVAVLRDNVEYVIPAQEFSISNVAKALKIEETSLKEIKVEVKITKLDESVVAKYNEVARINGAKIVFQPVEFEIVARTANTDGSSAEVKIDKFNNYVERILEIPHGVDPSKITTGIVFNPDATYNHVPTEIFQKNGKSFAKLNSLTNSNYSILWNPVKVAAVEKHWSKNAVNDLASRLVIMETKTFAPNKAITRADFADYMVRALGLYREGISHENRFKDVHSKDDKATAILIANEYGLLTGYPDGTFKPDRQITREEAMAIYFKAMSMTKLEGKDQARFKQYADYKSVAGWAQNSVQEVLSAHVFSGTSAKQISPRSNLTYAESAQAIRNLLVESKLINH